MTRHWDAPQRWVVDASVVVKWFVPENFSAEADAVLHDYTTLMAPDIIWAELGNVMWKKWRAGGVPAEKVEAILDAFALSQVRIFPSSGLYGQAWGIAADTRRTFYDSLYLALAVSAGALLVTADARFYHAISTTSWARHCVWIEAVG